MRARVSTPSRTLFTGQREREREKKRERGRKEREREKRKKEIVFIFIGMTGALTPFSYLV